MIIHEFQDLRLIPAYSGPAGQAAASGNMTFRPRLDVLPVAQRRLWPARDGWFLARHGGAHDIYRHPEIEGIVTLPRHRQVTPAVARSIAKKASWAQPATDEEKPGRPRWTAPVEVGDLISPVGEVLSRFQPSQRYFLLDEGRWGEDDLPRRNLVSALVGLENSRSAAGLSNVLEALSDWVEGPGEDELRRAFVEWVRQAVLLGRFGESVLPVVQALEGGGAMLAERVKEWTEQWLREGREQGLQQGLEQGREQGLERGIERGRAEERALLCRQASRKFDAETAERLSGLLNHLSDPERLAEVGDWIIECRTGSELLDRAGRIGHVS